LIKHIAYVVYKF